MTAPKSRVWLVFVFVLPVSRCGARSASVNTLNFLKSGVMDDIGDLMNIQTYRKVLLEVI